MSLKIKGGLSKKGEACLICRFVTVLSTIHSMKFYYVLWCFFLLRLLCVSINLPYAHVWNTVVMSGLVPLVLTVGPSLAASLEPLAHCQNVTSLSLFYRCLFGRCSSELAQLALLLFPQGRSTPYSDRLHDFSVTIPRCYKDVMSKVSFLAQLNCGILCLKNASLWPIILVVLSLELTDIF